MQNVNVIGWASLLLLFFLGSCGENIPEPDKIIISPEPIVLVESTIRGQVIDEQNNPIAEVSLKIGNLEEVTDENGFFEFTKEDVNTNGTHITANKLGYFFNSKMVNPAAGAESFVLFQMLDKVSIGNFNSSAGGQLNTSDGASVAFGTNSIMDNNGNTYSGVVEVYAKWLDPTDVMIGALMPGDLRALDSDESLGQLATYGMIVVELEAPNGSPLQINEGNTATITLPVPAELLSAAPSTIPLWSFDEESGYWLEESTAILQEGKYVGDVSHFSFWNCDVYFPFVNFETTVLDNDGNPLESVQVTIWNGNVGSGFAWTDSEGMVSGKIPKDQNLTIQVRDQCVLYTAAIGPFSGDVVLDPILVNTFQITNITGHLLKCDDSPVVDGYAFIDGDSHDRFLPTNELGEFSQSYFFCGFEEISIVGYDLEIPLASDTKTFTTPTNGGSLDVGEFTVCNEITNAIRIEIPELDYVSEFYIYSIEQYSAVDSITFTAMGDSTYLYMRIGIGDMEIGTAGMSPLFYQDYKNPLTQSLLFSCSEYSGSTLACSSHEVTTNEGAGGILEGSFVGNINAEENGTSQVYEFIIDYNVIIE